MLPTCEKLESLRSGEHRLTHAGSKPTGDSEYPDYKVVVGLCALVSLICSIDRASISVAIVPMSGEPCMPHLA